MPNENTLLDMWKPMCIACIGNRWELNQWDSTLFFFPWESESLVYNLGPHYVKEEKEFYKHVILM